MVLASAALSVLSTAVQLYLGYVRDRDRAFQEIAVIETSFMHSLENALWQFNFNQVELLLDGIQAQADIKYLKLDATTGQSWQRGSNDELELVIRTYVLDFEAQPNSAVNVGSLKVGLSLAEARNRVWEQFITLSLTNFMKALIAAGIMLMIFDRLVSRHLRNISRQLGVLKWDDDNVIVKISRSDPDKADDLVDIVDALNQARQAARNAVVDLERAARDLQETNHKLNEANREQAEFTYAISHDLKSPVNTLKMLTEELRIEESAQFSEDGKTVLKDLEQTILRMMRLIEDVLGYARTVGEDMVVEPIDLSELIAMILQDLQSDIADTGAQISTGPLPVVSGNESQFRMLFQNLISNAIKFRRSDEAPQIRITALPGREDGMVAISISDNGIGIDPEYHERIFGLFQRLHTRQPYSGSGLGLTICRRIVSNHGGRIEVSSERGDGTTFTVVLPSGSDGTSNTKRDAD